MPVDLLDNPCLPRRPIRRVQQTCRSGPARSTPRHSTRSMAGTASRFSCPFSNRRPMPTPARHQPGAEGKLIIQPTETVSARDRGTSIQQPILQIRRAQLRYARLQPFAHARPAAANGDWAEIRGPEPPDDWSPTCKAAPACSQSWRSGPCNPGRVPPPTIPPDRRLPAVAPVKRLRSFTR